MRGQRDHAQELPGLQVAPHFDGEAGVAIEALFGSHGAAAYYGPQGQTGHSFAAVPAVRPW